MTAVLHLTGTPLATTQGELTPLQRAFLDQAIPEAWSLLHGGGKRQGSGGSRGDVDPQLRRATEQRREGR